jgi:two-component system nitrate/nitrite response regulator NarP
MTRLLIADDHPLVLRGVESLFEGRPEFEIVTCSDGAKAWEIIAAGQCDLAILDLNMPGMTGLDVLRAARSQRSPVKVILLSAAIDDLSLAEAVRIGVDGLALKDTAASLLLTCVQSVLGGVNWIDRAAMTRAMKLLARPTGEGLPKLTEREATVASLVARGLRNKQIAEKANITEGTVKMHLHNIYEKLSVTSRTELALFMQRAG